MDKQNNALLTRSEVSSLLTISLTTLWRLEQTDTSFPIKIKLGQSRVVYKYNDIIEWVNKQ